jgi:curved DNA-binding protein
MQRTTRILRMFAKQTTKDYYRILELPASASAEEIKFSYKVLVKKYHPDINTGYEDKFKDVNEAYQVLSDVAAKVEYDRSQGYSGSGGSNTKESGPRKAYEEPADAKDR